MPSKENGSKGGDQQDGEGGGGIFGRLFSGKKGYKAAKMGEELKMYYNEEVCRGAQQVTQPAKCRCARPACGTPDW